MKYFTYIIAFFLLSRCLVSFADDEAYKPGSIRYGTTKWAKDVSSDNALPEYTRTMMACKDWLNLNGLWDYAGRPEDKTRVADVCNGKILV